MAKVTAAAIFVSLLSTVAFLLWFEGEVSFRPLIAASIFALVLTVPVTLFILAQVDKLDEADADLAEARRQLFAIHLELQEAEQTEESEQTADGKRVVPTIAGAAVVNPFQGAA